MKSSNWSGYRPYVFKWSAIIAFSFLSLIPQFLIAQQGGPLFVDTEEVATAELRQTSIFRSLEREEALEITIQTDLKKLIKGIGRSDYQPAVLSYQDVDGQPLEHLVEVRPRGKSRRKICDFPPLKIKFKKDHLERVGMQPEFNTLKMVTHCFNGDLSEQKLLREYLAYEVYNLVAEESFRTQLVRIKYVDSQNRMKTIEKYGVLLENNNEMADRLGGKLLKKYNLQQNQMQQDQYRTLCLFQYMVGNTDWRLNILHNIKAVRPTDGSSPIAVPYDFDFSGWVNTNYSIPNPEYELVSVKDRLFICDCTSSLEIEKTIATFLANEEAMIELVNNFELLHRKDRKELIKFMSSFFKTLDSPRKTKKAFIEKRSEISGIKAVAPNYQ